MRIPKSLRLIASPFLLLIAGLLGLIAFIARRVDEYASYYGYRLMELEDAD